MEDFNAKVGDERVEDVVGPSGIGTVIIGRGRSAKSVILQSQILRNETTLGDSGLGRAPQIEVDLTTNLLNAIYDSGTIPEVLCESVFIVLPKTPGATEC
ncbi:hypothetical protein PoB_002740500 [Plakobranchus ocellatus]|uniref:Uncharacterized protein n=1 Tax=Plakobranchus ocellatus TaxID=259542 RepID=A0AAV4A1W5_9GAST|nr:hypothetical protein PoB_002740500 [Plakobranchus ocellatus]